MVVVDGVLPPTVFRGLRICGALKPWNVHCITLYRLWGVVKPRNLSKAVRLYLSLFPMPPRTCFIKFQQSFTIKNKETPLGPLGWYPRQTGR